MILQTSLDPPGRTAGGRELAMKKEPECYDSDSYRYWSIHALIRE